MTEPADDALAVLLLPVPLEGFAREEHARGLLSIPRVVALEPLPHETARIPQDAICQRQARRLRFPRAVAGCWSSITRRSTPLARALCAR